LHAYKERGCSSSFDYVALIMRRASRVRTSQVPPEVQTMIRGLVEQLSTVPELDEPLVASHPDISPSNLIQTNSGFKIIDLELLGQNPLYLIDLFNVCLSFKLTGRQLERYVESYKNAGGNLHPLVKYWDHLMALWILRCLAGRLESDGEVSPSWFRNFQSENHGQRTTSFVGFEPQLLEIARCS